MSAISSCFSLKKPNNYWFVLFLFLGEGGVVQIYFYSKQVIDTT